MTHNVYIYLLVMAAVCYIIRVLPLTLLRKPVHSRFVRSFLYYVPYITLAVMTFPAITEATRIPLAGGAALLSGIILAWSGAGLFPTAVSCCLIVFILEQIFI